MADHTQLAALGWQPFFQQQLSLEEWDSAIPARVTEFHHSELRVQTGSGVLSIPLTPAMPPMVVGDWVLLDEDNNYSRLLERKSAFSRRASGAQVREQLIAANVDTAFIVSSLNDDFNLNRIERYLALVNEAGSEPVIVLSKADLSEDADQQLAETQRANPGVLVEAINGLDEASTAQLQPWLGTGKTVAVLGSSGVGKSTLINTLVEEPLQATGGIREDDSKGRHTTTSRTLVPLKGGGMILDTPGMREIQLANAGEGIEETFAEITALAEHCKFGDCQHQGEPGCGVQAAIDSGELEERRLASYQKLRREDAMNSATLAERRSQDKALGKYYKRAQSEAGRLKGRPD